MNELMELFKQLVIGELRSYLLGAIAISVVGLLIDLCVRLVKGYSILEEIVKEIGEILRTLIELITQFA